MGSPITDSTIVHQSLINLRDILQSGCTDPISGTRSATSKFITLKGSRRPKEFPVVVIDHVSSVGTPLGIQSEAMEMNLTFRADCQSTSVGYDAKGVDWVADDVINILRTSQRGVSTVSGTQSYGLHDLRILNTNSIDEPGPKGLHRKLITFNLNYSTDVS